MLVVTNTAMDANTISRLNWLTSIALYDAYCATIDGHKKNLYYKAWKSIPTDATIVCSNGTVSAFAAALIAMSDVFRVMLSGNFAESVDNIALPADSIEDIGDLVQYITYGFAPTYLHTFKMENFDRANRLLDLARRFNLKGLEFEAYQYRIADLHYHTHYFRAHLDIDTYPGSLANELPSSWSGYVESSTIYKLKIGLEKRFSCKIDLTMEPVSAGDHMLIYAVDGAELYSCKIPSEYVERCKKMVARAIKLSDK